MGGDGYCNMNPSNARKKKQYELKIGKLVLIGIRLHIIGVLNSRRWFSIIKCKIRVFSNSIAYTLSFY